MDWQLRENVLSPARMGRYLVKYERDVERAGRAYDQNVLLASALMPSLHILEIAVRNAINRCLTRSAQRSDWWVSLRQPEFDWLRAEVAEANRKLASRNELASPDKIVAELTFGSWTRLFNAACGPILWSQLRLAFPRCPKAKRQRTPIRKSLNQIRDLRNRVMHHEPLLWLSPSVHQVHQDILEVLDWIDPHIRPWLDQHDPLPDRWTSCCAL